MSALDVATERAALDAYIHGSGAVVRSACEPVVTIARRALDEIDASRKLTAYPFDVEAAREELARIDALWTEGQLRDSAFDSALALLDRALDALAAGWEPAGDVVERGALALRNSIHGDNATEWPDGEDEQSRATCMRDARAVLRAAGQAPVVDEVTAWTLANWPAHLGSAPATWKEAVRRLGTAEQRADVLRRVAEILGCDDDEATEDRARAIMGRLNGSRLTAPVVEYATSRGVAPAPPVTETPSVITDVPQGSPMGAFDGYRMTHQMQEPAPVDTGAAERLTRAEVERWQSEADAWEQIAIEHGTTILRMEANAARTPVDTGAAERLTAYRCTIAAVHESNLPAMRERWMNTSTPSGEDFEAWLTRRAEDRAHAMLAAERAPANGR